MQPALAESRQQPPTPPPPPPERASLLGLPGELRNQIYDYIINVGCQGDEALEFHCVQQDQFQQPALCRVNRQLRAEVLDLYYEHAEFHDSGFEVMIQDLQFGPQLDHVVWQRASVLICLTGSHSWANFKKWLRFYSQNAKVPIPADDANDRHDRAEVNVLRSAFALVKKLARAGQGWNVVEDALEDCRCATDGVDTWDDRAFWSA